MRIGSFCNPRSSNTSLHGRSDARSCRIKRHYLSVRANPHAAHLPPPLIRLLPQIDTGQREASYEIACGVGREDDEGGKNEIKALAAAGGSKVGGTRSSFRRAGAVECRAITFPAKVFDEAEFARSRRRIVIKGFGYHGMNRTGGGGSVSHGERSRDVEVVAT